MDTFIPFIIYSCLEIKIALPDHSFCRIEPFWECDCVPPGLLNEVVDQRVVQHRVQDQEAVSNGKTETKKERNGHEYFQKL